MSPPRRGEVILVDFTPARGHEQDGQRPALVLSVDTFNLSPGGLVTVLPITSKARAVRSRVFIRSSEGGLKLDSYVICEQTRTISISRISQTFGAVSRQTMTAVEGIVRQLLGL